MTGPGPRPCQIGNRAARAVARRTLAGLQGGMRRRRSRLHHVRVRSCAVANAAAPRTGAFVRGRKRACTRRGRDPDRSGSRVHAVRTGSGRSGTRLHVVRTRSAPAPHGSVAGADAICAPKQPACSLQSGFCAPQIAGARGAKAIRIDADRVRGVCRWVPCSAEPVRYACRQDSDGAKRVCTRCRGDLDRCRTRPRRVQRGF
jgi:hypothetical protein